MLELLVNMAQLVGIAIAAAALVGVLVEVVHET